MGIQQFYGEGVRVDALCISGEVLKTLLCRNIVLLHSRKGICAPTVCQAVLDVNRQWQGSPMRNVTQLWV